MNRIIPKDAGAPLGPNGSARPVTNGPGANDGGSLIERAAQAYGLDAFARPPARVSVTPAAEPRVQEAPVAPKPDPTPAPSGAEASTPVAVRPTTVAEPQIAPQGEPRPAAPQPAGTAAIDRERLAEAGMIVPGGPISVLAEEFRLVKRQLLSTRRKLGPGPTARTILVASARPNEGKTFCAINLAISLAAERDTRVLLIDGDFAKRDLMPQLGLENDRGFLDLLSDATIEPEALVVTTDVPGLSLLGAGTRTNDDTELLASERTRVVLNRLLEADPDRLVIFDSPPALAASPAGVFAQLSGQVMMVVRADVTSDSEIREGVALLDGCEHIQLVLNKVRHRPEGYRFGDYYAPAEKAK